MSNKRKEKLPIQYSRKAIIEIDKIWSWNEKTYDSIHASSYVRFLLREAERLCRKKDAGQPVEGFQDWRHLFVRQSKKGHGYIIVFRKTAQLIEILHFFHSAQDWQQRLIDESTPA